MKENYKKAFYRRIPAYFNEETNDIKGRNCIYDILIDINIWIDLNVIGIEEFPIIVEKDLNE